MDKKAKERFCSAILSHVDKFCPVKGNCWNIRDFEWELKKVNGKRVNGFLRGYKVILIKWKVN